MFRWRNQGLAGSKSAPARMSSGSLVQASRVRLTIRKTNNLEPCVDELEVYATTGKNVALASAGGRPSASGSNVSPNRHELRLVNDGEYGNSSSWMSSAMGGGWVQIDLPGTFTIDRVVWGRDRKGEYGDRLATDYVLEVAAGDGPWQAVADASARTVRFETFQNAIRTRSSPAGTADRSRQAGSRKAGPRKKPFELCGRGGIRLRRRFPNARQCQAPCPGRSGTTERPRRPRRAGTLRQALADLGDA